MTFEEKVIAAINDQKGQLMALEALAIALLRAMPLEMRGQAIREWDQETEVARTAFLNASIPDEVANAFDRYAKMIDDLRLFPPQR